MVAIDVLLGILQQYRKEVIGIGSIDCVFLAVLGIAYVYRGEGVSYSQFSNVFSIEAFGSMILVFMAIVAFVYIFYPKAKYEYEYSR